MPTNPELVGAVVARDERRERPRTSDEQRKADGAGEAPHTRRTVGAAEQPGRAGRAARRAAPRARREAAAPADEADVRAEQVEHDAERQPADDRADRALEPAEDGRGERVDQDRLHHVRRQEDARRDHHPAHRAERPPRSPSRARAATTCGRRAAALHRGFSAPARIARPSFVKRKNEPEHAHAGERHAERADVLLRDVHAADHPGRRRERAREELDLRRPDPAGEAVEDHEQRDRRHHDRQHARALERPDHDPLDADAADERDHDRGEERPPVREAVVRRSGSSRCTS